MVFIIKYLSMVSMYHCRLLLDEAAKIMKGSSDGVSGHVDIVHLKVSRGTAVEEFDQVAACLMETAEHEDLNSPVQEESALTNDGTNACAFISMKIADRLLGECTAVSKFFAALAKVVEDTIWNLPAEINAHRELHNTYDTLEAYTILNKLNLVGSYEFSEELPFADPVFSFREGKCSTQLCVIFSMTILSQFSQGILLF